MFLGTKNSAMNPNDVMKTLCYMEVALDDGYGSWKLDEVPANVSQIRDKYPDMFTEEDGELVTNRVKYTLWQKNMTKGLFR